MTAPTYSDVYGRAWDALSGVSPQLRDEIAHDAATDALVRPWVADPIRYACKVARASAWKSKRLRRNGTSRPFELNHPERLPATDAGPHDSAEIRDLVSFVSERVTALEAAAILSAIDNGGESRLATSAERQRLSRARRRARRLCGEPTA